MSKETVAFRMHTDDRVALDDLARLLDRDRSYLINDAVHSYLELHHWQAELIRERLAAADRGQPGVPHDEVFARLRTRIGEQTKQPGKK